MPSPLRERIYACHFHYLDAQKIKDGLCTFKSQRPFDHCIIDDFFSDEVAAKLENDFFSYSDERWYVYKNALEDKKVFNNWGSFPELTYQVFSELNSPDFLELLSNELGETFLPDPGLHGGGWHIHAKGGNLNPHLDYSIHPKLKLERKLNIIIYLSRSLEAGHGGHLGLWDHDETKRSPGHLIKSIEPKYNRAVLFDTTQNSWHGISTPLIQPEDIYRKSIAIYYLREPFMQPANRMRALFAPREEQKTDLHIHRLIQKRCDIELGPSVHRINS